eukprot:2132281-Pyramimonas_sp.AAC.1
MTGGEYLVVIGLDTGIRDTTSKSGVGDGDPPVGMTIPVPPANHRGVSGYIPVRGPITGEPAGNRVYTCRLHRVGEATSLNLGCTQTCATS